MHSIVGTAANVADVTQVGKLPHVAESVVSADVGYTGMKKRSEHEGRKVIWQIQLDAALTKNATKTLLCYKSIRKIKKAKAQIHARVEHRFR